MFLARAYVHVSHDPLVGADQKASKFYDRVLQQFISFMPGSQRSVQALGSRWKEMHTACAKFAGHFATVNAVIKSGWQENDYVEAALKTYQEIENSSFQHRLVWEYVRQHFPKFEHFATPKNNHSKRLRPESDSDSVEEVPTPSLKRPKGKNKRFLRLRKVTTTIIQPKSHVLLYRKQNAKMICCRSNIAWRYFQQICPSWMIWQKNIIYLNERLNLPSFESKQRN